MGNSQPNWFQSFKKEYKQEPTKEVHPYLGEISVYQHNTIESMKVMSKMVSLP